MHALDFQLEDRRDGGSRRGLCVMLCCFPRQETLCHIVSLHPVVWVLVKNFWG